MLEQESLVATEEPDQSLAAPPYVPSEEEQRTVPYNVEEQAAMLTLADDRVPAGSFGGQMKAVAELIKQGKAKALRQPIMEQEQSSYVEAMHDLAKKHAAIANMEGTQKALEVALDLQQRTRTPNLDNTTEHTIIAQRTVERLYPTDPQNREIPIERVEPNIRKWTEKFGLRTAILSILEKEGDTPIVDGAAYIGNMFLPITWAGYDVLFHKVAERATGKKIELSTNPLGWMDAIYQRWDEVDETGKKALLWSIKNDEYGYFGDNLMAKKVMLDMLANYDTVKGTWAQAGMVAGLGFDIFATLGTAMRLAVRAGTPAKVFAETVGKRFIGKELADAMVTDNLTRLGINDAEAVGKAIAAGEHPYSVVDPAKFDGASPHLQAQLRDHWVRMVAAEEDRLIASGIPAAEREATLKAIRESYSPAVRKDVYAIKFAGAPDGDRVRFTVLLTDEEGKLHATEEGARSYARRRGLADDAWTLTTPAKEAATEEVIVRSLIKAFHGGDDFTDFRKAFVGMGSGGNSLGHGFYTTLVRDMAERFARGRSLEGKAGTLYELNLPDVKHFLDFNKKFTAQSDEVKRALANVLNGAEIPVLKNADGREVYRVLTKRLGSEARASTALEKVGIAGNTGTTMGRDRELVVFSEEVMNNALVRKQAVSEVETAAQRAARKAGETAGDEQANALLQEFGAAASDAPRMAVKLHKSFMDIPAEANKALTKTATNFDNPTLPIWGKGDAPVQFSGAFNAEAQRWANGFTKLLGLDGQRILFLTAPDLEKASARLEFTVKTEGAWSRHVFAAREALAAKAEGTYTRVMTSSGQLFHVITVNQKAHELENVINLSHEIGHLFKDVYLSELRQPEAKALAIDFIEWLSRNKKGGAYNIPALMERVSVPTKENVNTYLNLRLMTPEGAKDLGVVNYRNWLLDYHEYVAEQTAKWAMTDARAVTLGEKVWATWAERINAYFRAVAKDLRGLFGQEKLKLEPEQLFKTLMDSHIAAVQRGEAQLSVDYRISQMRFNQKGPAPDEAMRAATEAAEAAPHVKPGFLVKLKVDDPLHTKGVYDPTDIDSMPWIAADPRHGVSVDAMAGRVIGVHQTAKIQRDMTEMLKPALSPLSKKQRERVLTVLEEGDQASWSGGYGMEFSTSELLARGFTDPELRAYYTVRQARQLNYFIHNKALVDSMRRRGLMEIEVFGQGKMAGKALTVEEARTFDGKLVYDMRKKEFVELNADASYATGQRLIKAEAGSTVDGQEVTRFLATDKEATARTIHTAIHYRPGEFARIYSDNYFIRMTSSRMVNGAKTAVEHPIRTAATQKEAEAFIKAMVEGKAAVEAGVGSDLLETIVGKHYSAEEFRDMVVVGELKDMTAMRFHFTREVDDYLGQTIESHAHTGKLFTRDRGEHILTADRTRAARSNILNPYESLSREIAMVSHFANVTEWKEAQMERWMNSFGDMLGKNRTGDDVRDFFSAAGARFSHVTGKQGLFAERTHAYIMRQVGIQTQEHQWWQSLMRRIGEGSQPYVGEGIGAVIRDANPLNFIRSINHHFTLGLFNLSQLVVQANGMSIAAAIHPILGLKSATMFPALRIALMSDNPEVWARISKVAGEDIGRVAAAIRRSGLIDNLRSTSLHNIEDGKMDIFASLPQRSLATARDKGAFAFNRGEEFARVVAFDIARREWMKLNPDKAFDSQAGMQWILSKSDDYTMNMTRANLARWQEGVMSIPTQFLQYNIKLAQNIASGLISGGGKGRGFTRAEALKALGGSIAFYGAAGMGVSGLVGEWVGEENAAKLPPVARTAIGQGMIAAAFKAVGEATTGERFDVAFGPRLGSINYFTDLVYNAYHDPKNIYEVMLGPTLSTVNRIAVISDIAGLWRRQEEVTLADVGKGSLDFFTEQVSSLRNVTKAYYISQGENVLRNRKGEAVAELSTPEIWAQAVGFAPSAAYDYYQMVASRRDHFKALDDISTMILSTHKKILEAQNAGDEERADRMYKALALMYPTNYGDFVHVRQQVREKLAPYDTAFMKLLSEHAMKGNVYNQPFQTTTPEVKR